MVLRLALLGSALLTAGCPHDTVPPEGEQCVTSPECDPDAEPEVAEIGSRGDGFRAWQDGEVVEIISGGQGAVMILPSFCMPVPADGGDDACVGMVLTNDLDGADGGGSDDEGDGEGPFTRRFRFRRDGDRLCGGPLYDQLGYSRSDFGDAATVAVDLCGAGVHATGRVHVTF